MEKKMKIIVNGKNIPLSEFPADIITGAILGMLSSLKGVENIDNFEISLK